MRKGVNERKQKSNGEKLKAERFWEISEYIKTKGGLMTKIMRRQTDTYTHKQEWRSGITTEFINFKIKFKRKPASGGACF